MSELHLTEHPPARRLRSTYRLLGASAACGVAAASLLLASPAHAVDPQRETLPVVAGTVLQMPNRTDCTAGLVLQCNRSTSFFNLLTASRRATRYVLTAAHCAPMGASVSVGGIPIGTVTWKSTISDLELITVAPRNSRYQHCTIGSHREPVCHIYVDSEPRALGRVILASLRTRTITGVPVTGVGGTPPDDEEFCTSGKVTGLSCGWSNSPFPPGITPRTGEKAATSINTVLVGGDSGSPVSSADGHVYGLVSRGFGTVTTMLYVSTDQFFREQSSYAPAPA